MGEHHRLSPSKYNAWVHCPCWDSDDKQNNEASVGTLNHKELEMGLRDESYEPNTYVARWARDVILGLADGCTVMPEYRVVGTLGPVDGIYGTADVFWIDNGGRWHFADLKTFSDGTDNYLPQLEGYAYLYATEKDVGDQAVVFHILHGGTCQVETVNTTLFKCITDVNTILASLRSENKKRCINKYCQYCKHIKECPMSNSAIQTVADNNSVEFSKMSLPQKLVVCDAVEKLIKTLKEDAKRQAIDNGGRLEADGIVYEIKERAGKGRVRDLCELASAINMLKTSMGYDTITQEQLLSLCELPKTALTQALKDANRDRKDVKKKDIESWIAGFYEKGEPTQYLARTV